jgi:hypothetical protein
MYPSFKKEDPTIGADDEHKSDILDGVVIYIGTSLALQQTDLMELGEISFFLCPPIASGLPLFFLSSLSFFSLP